MNHYWVFHQAVRPYKLEYGAAIPESTPLRYPAPSAPGVET
jgi:hypothetical protein